MGVKFNLDAFFELGEKIHAKMGEYDRYLTEVSAFIRNYDRGVLNSVTENTFLDSAGFGIIDVGGPPTGFRWIVRLITISDASAWANSTGAAVAQFGIGNSDSNQGIFAMPAPTVRWPFAVLPNAATFSTNHFTSESSSDHVYCQVVGGTANQNFQATVCYEQWPITRAPREL